MITSVTVRVTNLDATGARLEAIKAALADMTDVMTSLAAKLIAFYEDTVFVSQGAALGETWTPLAKSTTAEKNKNWPGRGTLVRSGELQHGFTPEITPVSLLITNKVMTPDGKYNLLSIHQNGTSSAGRGRSTTIPARKMLAINGAVESIIREDITTAIRAKIDGVRV